jgi:hypothetical protein
MRHEETTPTTIIRVVKHNENLRDILLMKCKEEERKKSVV